MLCVVSRATNTQFSVAGHALSMLSSVPGEPLSSEIIAGSAGSSPVYVRRVLGLLRRGGLVASRPGAHGGWHLTRPAAEIRLGDVWRAVQGDEPVLGLHAPVGDCPVGGEVGGLMAEVERRTASAIERELDTMTVADLTPSRAPFTLAMLAPPAAA
jgi:Rrf2 family protein